MTDVPSRTRSVRSPTAASHAMENGAWPPVWRQGWKWSEIITLSRPTCSACTANSTSSRGLNCSAEALYPIRSVMRDSFTYPPRTRAPTRRSSHGGDEQGVPACAFGHNALVVDRESGRLDPVAIGRSLRVAPQHLGAVSPGDGVVAGTNAGDLVLSCLLYTSPSPRDGLLSRMPSSA